MPPDIYQRFLEQQEQQVAKKENKPPMPAVNVPLNKKKRNTLLIAVIAVILVILGLWVIRSKTSDKAAAIKLERDKLIDLRFRESVAHQDSICKWDAEKQLLLTQIDSLIKYKPYVQIRKKYIDLTLPDAIHVFDSANYPQ